MTQWKLWNPFLTICATFWTCDFGPTWFHWEKNKVKCIISWCFCILKGFTECHQKLFPLSIEPSCSIYTCEIHCTEELDQFLWQHLFQKATTKTTNYLHDMQAKSCAKHTTCKHYLLDVCQPAWKLYSCTWFSSLSSRVSIACLFILSCISEFIVTSCPIAASCSTILVSWYWMTFSSCCILSAKSLGLDFLFVLKEKQFNTKYQMITLAKWHFTVHEMKQNLKMHTVSTLS